MHPSPEGEGEFLIREIAGPLRILFVSERMLTAIAAAPTL